MSKNKKIMLIKALADVVKSRRNSKSKTIYAISAEISMSKSTWREVELGLCKDINLTTFWKIAEALEIAPSQLLEDVQNKLGKEFSLTELD